MYPQVHLCTFRLARSAGKLLLFPFILVLLSCQEEIDYPDIEKHQVIISKDKAMYAPLEQIKLSIDIELPATTRIRYRHLNEVIHESAYQGTAWVWQAPPGNYKGYMVELYSVENNREAIHASIGIDVSTDWKKFPRYGYLSNFSNQANTNDVIENLNRHHINGILFFDWQQKPHMPLPVSTGDPNQVWQSFANQAVSLKTLKNYITKAGNRNMTTFFHNFAYCVTSGAHYDGVAQSWHLFRDTNRSERDIQNLPKPPFANDLYVMNPASLGWQQYIRQKNHEIFAALNFDGWHIDQLGDRGNVYDFNGNVVPLATDFKPFLDYIKDDNPSSRLICNALNQFGQYAIAHSPVDVLYTEVEPPHETFSDLSRIIINNNSFSNNTRQSVLAAFINSERGRRPEYFNTPTVLFTNAVIFAFGGSRMELGEHMASNKYLPDLSYQMNNELKGSLLNYYDFLVAYQNLLRDGGVFNKPSIVVANRACCTSHWPPIKDNIAVVGKNFDTMQVVHMINFLDVKSFSWQNNTNDIPAPVRQNNLTIVHSTNRAVSKIWFASPDVNHGSSSSLDYLQTDTEVVFTVPSLDYWSMFVIEYK